MMPNRFPHLAILTVFTVLVVLIVGCKPKNERVVAFEEAATDTLDVVTAPDTATIPDNDFGDLVRYGRELILYTARYIGPDGTAGKYLGNKMNCTNCHLDAGTRPFGLNYYSTHGRYPQYRARENRILTLADRVNNCIERPHNGKAMPVESKEMLAIICYIKWLGEGIPVDQRVDGDDGMELRLPDYQLDIKNGRCVYHRECARCHGVHGEGKFLPDNSTYEYPPLWGMTSYEPGSSMFRIIKAARFIKANMPHDKATWKKPVLSDRDALDVAAFVNSEEHERPAKEGLDYPNVKTKPIDYPYGPYDDHFSEEQHKYGPYKPIIDFRKKKGLYVNY